MIGPEGVVDLIHARMVAAIPGKLAEFRTRYGVSIGALENPRAILAHQPAPTDVAWDKLPLYSIVPMNTDSLAGPVRIDTDGVGDVYGFRYRVAVYLWARGKDIQGTSRAIHRHTLAVRETLFQLKALGAEQLVRLDPGTWSESYSDVDQTARQALAAVRIEVEYMVEETLPVIPPPVAVDAAVAAAVDEGVTP